MSYHLVSQLSHVEVLTPKPDESVTFFKDVLGLQESHREGQSVWLRAWGEYFHHSLKVTEGPVPGLAHAAWRVDGPDDLEIAAKALTDAGVDGGWSDGDVGHGKSYQFTMPGGHNFELVWDFDRYVAPPELQSVYPNRPQKQVAHNAAVRRIDHCTVGSTAAQADRDIFVDALKFRHMEGTKLPNGQEIFIALTSGAHNHDYAIGPVPPGYDGPGGFLHHVCYYYDTREELLRSLDILAENGYKLETGPHKHGIGELFFVYVFEPGGNRVELQTGGYWNYIPDWEPVIWNPEQGGNIAWQVLQMPPTGTPHPPDAIAMTTTQAYAEDKVPSKA